MVGRNPIVTKAEIIALIERWIDKGYFLTEDFPTFGDQLWKLMRDDLAKRWSIRTIYTHIRQNKRGDLEQARKNRGIVVPPVEPKHVFVDEIIVEEEESDEEDNDDDDVEWIPDDEPTKSKLETFHLQLTTDEWNKIRPTEEVKNRLRSKTWAAVISQAIKKRYNMECGFLAKSSYISPNFDENKHKYFLKIQASCADREKCKNKLVGTAKSGPTEKGLELLIRMVDTRGHFHKPVIRPLNGNERNEMKAHLLRRQAANYREQRLEEDMEFGENVPHDIRKNQIYRQVRLEAGKEAMGKKSRESLNVIQSLQKMATSALFKGSIHELGALRFYVMYCSTHQLLAYQEYVRLLKKNAEVAIDASGKMAKSFEICPGKQTGHIFLYSITISFENKTVCVYQALTEIHTQEHIEYWLKLFSRLGAPAPGRVVSDYERAIPMSCSLAFNNMSFKEYIDVCYVWASSKEKKDSRPARTIIRIDVAHIMHLVAGWKSVKNERHKTVKDTRLHCVALMIDARTVEKFARIFVLTNVISLHPFSDTITTIEGEQIKVSDALRELEEAIGNREQSIKNLEQSMSVYEENKKGEKIPEFTEGENDTLTHKFVKKLIQKARPSPSDVEGKIVNGFYNEDFAKALERLGKEFPAWSGVTEPHSDVHASSAYQEGYFARLRQSIRESVQLPCSADRFVYEHLKRLQSGINELGSQLKKANHDRKSLCPSVIYEQSTTAPLKEETILHVPPVKVHLPDDSDLKSYEPWGGLKNKGPGFMDIESSGDDEPKGGKNNRAKPKFRNKVHIDDSDDVTNSFHDNKEVIFTAYKSDGPIMEDLEISTMTESHKAKEDGDGVKSSIPPEPQEKSKKRDSDNCNDPLHKNESSREFQPLRSNARQKKDGMIQSKPEVVFSNVDIHLDGEKSLLDTTRCNSPMNNNCVENPLLTTSSLEVDRSAATRVNSAEPLQVTSPLSHRNFTSTPLADHSYASKNPPAAHEILEDITNWYHDDIVLEAKGHAKNLNMQQNGNTHLETSNIEQVHIITITDSSETSSLHLSPGEKIGEGPKLLARIGSCKRKIKHAEIENNGYGKRIGSHKNGKSTSSAYYFQNRKELRIMNQRLGTKKKGLLFPNGNRCSKPLRIKLNDKVQWKLDSSIKMELLPKEIKVRALNTCGFDSIFHVLEFSVIDYPLYESFAKDSGSETLKLLRNFMQKGLTVEVQQERLRILNRLSDINEPQLRLLPYRLDAVHNIDTIWRRFLEEEPSGYRSFKCKNPNCSGEPTSIPLIPVNEKIIRNSGYQDLQRALQYYPIIFKKKCPSKCGEEGEEHTTLNAHIFISLDVRERQDKSRTMEGRLNDFPHYLQLEKTYRLVGIIHHEPGISPADIGQGPYQNSEPGHFTAFCLRSSGSWIHCDDMQESINFKCTPDKTVKPHAAIYIICETKHND